MTTGAGHETPGAPGPEELAGLVSAGTRSAPDFPRSGVMFADLAPLLADPSARRRVVAGLAALAAPVVADADVRSVVAVDARGFVLGSLLAEELGLGLVLARKAGKLPGPTLERSFSLEYGEATLELQADAVPPGTAVLVVDDVLATGGTVAAAADLVAQAGGVVAAVVVLLEIAALEGRDALGDVPLLVAQTLADSSDSSDDSP